MDSDIQIGVFVDVSNIYYCCGKKFPNRKVDYKKLLETINKQGNIFRAIAYGIQKDHEAIGFISCLKALGFDTKFKQALIVGDKVDRRSTWDVGITVDIVRMMDRVDKIVLVTSDGDLAETVQLVKEEGLQCTVIGCGISRALKDAANIYIELSEEVLEDEVPKTTE